MAKKQAQPEVVVLQVGDKVLWKGIEVVITKIEDSGVHHAGNLTLRIVTDEPDQFSKVV